MGPFFNDLPEMFNDLPEMFNDVDTINENGWIVPSPEDLQNAFNNLTPMIPIVTEPFFSDAGVHDDEGSEIPNDYDDDDDVIELPLIKTPLIKHSDEDIPFDNMPVVEDPVKEDHSNILVIQFEGFMNDLKNTTGTIFNHMESFFKKNIPEHAEEIEKLKYDLKNEKSLNKNLENEVSDLQDEINKLKKN